MTKTQTTFSVFAVTLVLVAMFPMFPMFNQPTAVAQSEEGGGFGACYLETIGGNGACDVDFVTADECASLAGFWFGEGTVCPIGEVEFPGGGYSTACCLGDGTCAVLIPGLCVEAGGTASPEGTPCSAVTCPQPCAADFDNDGIVGIVDFLKLLSNWGPCP